MFKALLIAIAAISFSQAAVSKDKELKICYENWWPYIENTKGVAKGIAVDIIEEALKRKGYTTKWVEMVAKRCYVEVEAGRFEMTMNVSHLPEVKWIESKTVILDWELAAIVNKKDPIEKYESMSQFKGKTLGMTRGYLYPEEIDKEIKKMKIDEVADPEMNLGKLSMGRIGLLIEDPLWAEKISKRDKLDVKVLAPSIALDPTYVTFTPKLKDLAEAYDQEIIKMANDGDIDKIYIKHIGKPYSGTARIKALKK